MDSLKVEQSEDKKQDADNDKKESDEKAGSEKAKSLKGSDPDNEGDWVDADEKSSKKSGDDESSEE